MKQSPRLRIVVVAIVMAALCDLGGLIGIFFLLIAGFITIFLTSRGQKEDISLPGNLAAGRSKYMTWLLGTVAFAIGALLISPFSPGPGPALGLGLAAFAPLFGTIIYFADSVISEKLEGKSTDR
jgi:hypothetical protein